MTPWEKLVLRCLRELLRSYSGRRVDSLMAEITGLLREHK